MKQEKEIQMKMIVTRGESVLQNTSPEGIPAIQQQLASVKDMWASLLSAAIHCKRLVKLKGYCQVIAKRSTEELSNTPSRVSPVLSWCLFHSLYCPAPLFLASFFPSFPPSFLFCFLLGRKESGRCDLAFTLTCSTVSVFLCNYNYSSCWCSLLKKTTG